jgi:hypothetical protein
VSEVDFAENDFVVRSGPRQKKRDRDVEFEDLNTNRISTPPSLHPIFIGLDYALPQSDAAPARRAVSQLMASLGVPCDGFWSQKPTSYRLAKGRKSALRRFWLLCASSLERRLRLQNAAKLCQTRP